MKYCPDCQQDRALDEFYGKGGDGRGSQYSTRCRGCHKLRVILRKYGITLDHLVLLLVAGNYRCYICQRTPEEAGEPTLCVDHCHESNEVRGMLCKTCNVALGGFRDDQNALRNAGWDRAADYLKIFQKSAKNPTENPTT